MFAALDTPTAVLPPTLMEEEKDSVDADAELVQPAVPAGKSRAGLDDAEDSVPAQNGHESSSKSPIPDVLNAGPDHSLESRSRSQRLSGDSFWAIHMLWACDCVICSVAMCLLQWVA